MTHPPAKDFGSLIRWLADTYHRGSLFRLAARVGVSGGLPWHWAGNIVKTPDLKILKRIAELYDLDFPWVVRLVPQHATLLHELERWERRQARLRRQSRVARILIFLLVFPPIVGAASGTPHRWVVNGTEVPLIGHWRRHWAEWLAAWPEPCIA